MDGEDQGVSRPAGGAVLAECLQLAREAAGMRLLGAPDPVAWPRDWADWQDTLEWFDARHDALMTALSVAAAEGFDKVAVELAFALERYLEGRQRHAEMLEVADAAVAAAGRLADRAGAGRALTWRGVALFRLGRFQDTVTACEQALVIFAETGDGDDEAEALGVTSPALGNLGRSAEALAAARRAVAIRQAAGDRHGTARVLVNLAFILLGQRQLSDAEDASRQAVAAYGETADRFGEGEALGLLGLITYRAGQIDQSVAALTGAVRCHQDFGDHAGQASMLRMLATVAGRDQPDHAPAPLREAAELYRQAGDTANHAETLCELGAALARTRSGREAAQAYQTAAALYTSIGDTQRAAQATAQARHGKRWRP
jgi:tetratricopeptide (TPR) repeat protein